MIYFLRAPMPEASRAISRATASRSRSGIDTLPALIAPSTSEDAA